MGKRNEKQKSSSLTRKTKGGRPYKRLGSNNARRLLRAQGRQKKVRRTPSNCHQLPLAVRTVIQEKDNPTSNKGEKNSLSYYKAAGSNTRLTNPEPGKTSSSWSRSQSRIHCIQPLTHSVPAALFFLYPTLPFPLKHAQLGQNALSYLAAPTPKCVPVYTLYCPEAERKGCGDPVAGAAPATGCLA